MDTYGVVEHLGTISLNKCPIIRNPNNSISTEQNSSKTRNYYKGK